MSRNSIWQGDHSTTVPFVKFRRNTKTTKSLMWLIFKKLTISRNETMVNSCNIIFPLSIRVTVGVSNPSRIVGAFSFKTFNYKQIITTAYIRKAWGIKKIVTCRLDNYNKIIFNLVITSVAYNTLNIYKRGCCLIYITLNRDTDVCKWSCTTMSDRRENVLFFKTLYDGCDMPHIRPLNRVARCHVCVCPKKH